MIRASMPMTEGSVSNEWARTWLREHLQAEEPAPPVVEYEVGGVPVRVRGAHAALIVVVPAARQAGDNAAAARGEIAT